MLRIALISSALVVTACHAAPEPKSHDVAKTEFTSLGKGQYEVSVTSIYDGDTFKFNMPGLPTELNPLSVRLRGVDTPERNPKAACPAEHELAMRAREFTKRKINETNGRIIVGDLKWDKYGGRVDADVFVGKNRESLPALLIQNGYGRPYGGEKRIKDRWCVEAKSSSTTE